MSSQGASFTGCAGWSLPRASQLTFGHGDSHLERYATRLNAVEINSSFYRPHSHATYARWAASVPAGFRFAVKLPKAITHANRLVECGALLKEFLTQVIGLHLRLGCLLAQLPPSLAFDPSVARAFFELLRSCHTGPVAVEPRHASWFSQEADALLASLELARVLADPVLHDKGRWPGGWRGLVYLRLHGSPRTYYSAYEPALLHRLAQRIALERRAGHTVWCVFDNTASGAAVCNALVLAEALNQENS